VAESGGMCRVGFWAARRPIGVVQDATPGFWDPWNPFLAFVWVVVRSLWLWRERVVISGGLEWLHLTLHPTVCTSLCA
jgi:hypothetical protein